MPISALDALKSLANKPQAPVEIPAQIGDPAIAGARKVGSGVVLGLDLSIAERAAYAAKLKEALDRAEQDWSVVQQEMRDYGASKRIAYNDAFKACIVTVKVPYEVDTPTGKEVRAVQVTCTNKYSVEQEMVQGNKHALGEAYDRLFDEKSTKTLKPNAEELIRGVLREAGLSDAEVDSSMEALFEKSTRVSAKECYEQEILHMPIEVQQLLSKMVRRQQPAVKI